MKIISLVLLWIFAATFAGCNRNHSAAMNEFNAVTVQPTASPRGHPEIATTATNAKANDSSEQATGNEITGCSPQKVYRGESFKISFKKSHGQYLAIYYEKTRDFYFLTANGQWYFPSVSPGEFKDYLTVKLDTSEVRNRTDEEVDSVGGYKTKLFFNKTGWYQVIIGHQGLDVNFIDMPVTGSCRIYYVNKKRPPGK